MKYNYLLLLLLMLGSTSFSFSQEMVSPASACKTRIGITVTPLFAYLDRVNTNDDPLVDTLIDLWNEIETTKLGYAVGVHLQLPVSRTIRLESGVEYTQKSRSITHEDLHWPGGPFPDPTAPDKVETSYNLHHLDIPVGIAWTTGHKKIQWLLGAGLTTNVFLNEQLVQNVHYNNGNTERTSNKVDADYTAVTFSPYIKAGLQCYLSSRTHLAIAPIVQYGLVKVSETPITWKVWHAGMQIGWYYCL